MAAASLSSSSFSRHSSSDGSDGDARRVPVVDAVDRPRAPSAPRDSCTWYANETCSRPRSCFDCLNARLADGSECTITPYGECAPLSAYLHADDFRAHAQSELYSFYPSPNTTYCSQTEPGCADCRLRLVTTTANGLHGYLYSRTTKAQCTGVDGCVCVAACEALEWRKNVLTRQNCPASAVAPSSAPPPMKLFSFHSSKIAYVLMGISLAGLAILLFLVHRWWLGHRREERRRARFATLRLQLDGWYAMRQKLIDDENTEIGVKPKLTLQHDGNDSDLERGVDGADADDGVDEDRAARLVIERGPGYRPMSPSEYERHRSQGARDAPAA